MPNFHIHITGVVQGVGFRPLVYHLAKSLYLTGWVCNDTDGVHIEISGTQAKCKEFYAKLIEQAPPLSKIMHTHITPSKDATFSNFEIRESENLGTSTAMITPDLGLCAKCKTEILDKNDARYHYWFTTCTQCGPRYSIIRQLPYDRANTSMALFEMCNKCYTEYTNIAHRRFYAQTNSCIHCGIKLSLILPSGEDIEEERAVAKTVSLLKEGKIVAIKGIGGFLLLCDASNADSIETLRKRKHRPSKPFALLYPNLHQAEHDVCISNIEKDALCGIEAPIVLLKTRNKTLNIVKQQIAPQTERIGIMLPYAPLLAGICNEFNKPLVATSANISGSPIFYDNKNAIENLTKIADAILIHNRPIIFPQDDSVIQFSDKYEQKIILRRARGLAPNLPTNFIHDSLLAMGAQNKSTFALAQNSTCYSSQYLGNLDNFDACETYKNILKQFSNIIHHNPTVVLTDLHPEYFASQLGLELAQTKSIALKQVQHHEAHFCAILGEHHLLNKKDAILGVIWDGTGLGTDGNIWGGEFFIYQQKQIKRIHHLKYSPHILGDKMSQEPRIAAWALGIESPILTHKVSANFNALEQQIYAKYFEKTQLQTSSMGRLFDAVASMLSLCQKTNFEGEAALMLENLAKQSSLKLEDFNTITPYHIDIQGIALDFLPLLHGIYQDLNAKISTSDIAFKFHLSLVYLIKNIATLHYTKNIAFSGGVFQNSLLCDMIIEVLSAKYCLYFHTELSPNDENISFGQLVHYVI